ncbi:MAG: type I-B CRISPR-associated endonuclease Cas1 [Ignavibacteriaceae bacterium]|nr:type I-B CRISPR-associated endonuclease Cas1 [Ignavibacteriaceae bacterium]
MKQNIYIFSDTLLRRKENTVWLEKVIKETDDEDYEDEIKFRQEYLLGEDILLPAGEKKCIPVESIDSIIAFGTVNFNSRFMHFLSQNEIPLHLFSLGGNYGGSFLPSERSCSGNLLIKQVHFHNHKLKRLEIAKQITNAAVSNALANLKYHLNRGAQLKEYFDDMTEIKNYISGATDIDELMGLEGTAKRIYYSCWKKIFTQPVDFTARVKNPPNNLINALISYGNMVVYSVCLNEIYHTRLYPEIGFIHQPGENKMSLSYDLADIFKPLITDRVIFKVINKNIISEKDAVIKNNRCFLKKEAKQKFAREIDDKLMTKIQLDGKPVKYSYRRIIREECYKLIKQFNDEENYNAYITKW